VKRRVAVVWAALLCCGQLGFGGVAAAQPPAPYTFLAAARVGSAVVTVFGTSAPSAGALSPPNFLIGVRARRGAASELDLFSFHLHGSWLRTGRRVTRVQTAGQLGKVGRIAVALKGAALRKGPVCPAALLGPRNRAQAHGAILLHLGKGPFARIRLRVVGAAVFPTPSKVPPCLQPPLPAPPQLPTSGERPWLVLSAGGLAGGTRLEAYTDKRLALLVLANSTVGPAAVVHALQVKGLPHSALKAVGKGAGRLALPAKLAPYAKGSLRVGTEHLGAAGCPQAAVGRGKLTFALALGFKLTVPGGAGLACL